MNIQEVIKMPFPFRAKNWAKNQIAFLDTDKTVKFAELGIGIQSLVMTESNINNETFEPVIGLSKNEKSSPTMRLTDVLQDAAVIAGKRLFRSQSWADNRLARVGEGGINLHYCIFGDSWKNLCLTVKDIQAVDYLTFDFQPDTTKAE